MNLIMNTNAKNNFENNNYKKIIFFFKNIIIANVNKSNINYDFKNI